MAIAGCRICEIPEWRLLGVAYAKFPACRNERYFDWQLLGVASAKFPAGDRFCRIAKFPAGDL
jgi:hypothetical protein